jgi:hypothetical protein
VICQPLNDPQMFEKTTPRSQTAVRRQRFIRARDREFARQRVQENSALLFSCQMNRNQRCKCAHHPQFYSFIHPLTTTSIADIGFNWITASMTSFSVAMKSNPRSAVSAGEWNYLAGSNLSMASFMARR